MPLLNSFKRFPGRCVLASIGALSLIIFATYFFIVADQSECEKQYHFVNADVVCGEPDVIRKTGYVEMRAAIEELIASYDTIETSVYFRDLVRGPVMGINELADFAPASLLKMPLAFVFLRSAEVQPELLEKKIVYSGVSSIASQNVSSSQTAKEQTEYSIEELLRLMIAYSDKASYEVLESFLSKDAHRRMLRTDTFKDLGLIDPRSALEEVVTTSRYASLFRLLYNASYLSIEGSEQLLSWLQESDYQNGLRAGVPANIPIAHKFGERIAPDGSQQLHDCGIVYYPGNPYLICIMTKGNSLTQSSELMERIAEMVYEEVDSRRL